MRLTAQIIGESPIILNPEGQLTLQLRHLKIPYLENLGITQDRFKVIDLTDNELTEISDIPILKNLEVLLLANNNIYTINDNHEDLFQTNLPNLKSISLINNNITNFSDIKALSATNIQNLTLLGNPIKESANYRLFVIWLIPSLKILDFKKVKEAERKKALELYGKDFTNRTEQALLLLGRVTKNSSNAASKEEKNIKNVLKKLTEEDKKDLLKKLETAESLEEIEKIETALKSGYF